MKPELGSAVGRDWRIRARVEDGVWVELVERRCAIRRVVERDFPMALVGGGAIS